MKKTNSILKRLIVASFTLLLILSCFAACRKASVETSSDKDIISSTEVNTSSEENPSSAETTTSDESTPTSKEETISSAPSSSSVPSSSTPTQSSKPTSTSESKPESKPETPAKKTPQELIIGKWEGMCDVGPEFEELGYTIEGDTKIKTWLEYTSTGTAIASIDMVSFKTLMRPILKQSIEETRQQEITKNNMTPEEWDALFLEENGMTVDEYIEEVLVMFNDVLNVVSEYKFAGDTLLVKDPYTEQFVESQYRFPDDNTYIDIESGVETIFKRIG